MRIFFFIPKGCLNKTPNLFHPTHVSTPLGVFVINCVGALPFICALVTCTKVLSAGWTGYGQTLISVSDVSLHIGFGTTLVPFTLLSCFVTFCGAITICGVCSSTCRFYKVNTTNYAVKVHGFGVLCKCWRSNSFFVWNGSGGR